MPSFDSGVASYVKAEAIIKVNFPVDEIGRAEIACRHCPYLSSNARRKI